MLKLFQRNRGEWIRTRSGLKFYFEDPRPEDILIEDIAFHLAGLNRFTGACALDHSYDRTHNGIPNGIPADLEAKLAPVVAYHLSLIASNWERTTIYMEDDQLEAFRNALIAAVGQ